VHELSLVRNLLSIILDRASGAKALRVVSVDLAVGELCDARPEWVERYFRLAAKGTIAEGASLRFSVIESTASCEACGSAFRPALRGRTKIRCPDCGSDECALSLGTDYCIERMEVL
jgi:hydrogenase nickel incorporation protein HypA/HybF